MRDEYLVFGSPVIEAEELDEVQRSLASGWIGTGPKVAQFEQMLVAYIGVREVRCLASGTAALFLGMHVLGIGPGDEVLVPTMTFVASANAVEHAGAVPVLVDCEPETGLIDLDAAAAAITPRTKAMMVVHLAGRPMDMGAVNAFRDRHSLLVIEDAAHAIGAEWAGRRIGVFGNVTAYSFYVTKNITTGEGGAIATNDSTVAAAAERLALHGLSEGAWARFSDRGFKHYECVAPGYKFNMTDIEASLGIHQLPRLDRWIDRRAELWKNYDGLLADLSVELPPSAALRSRHARHLYQVLIEPGASVSRDEVVDRLHRRGIGTGVHFRAVHLHPYYRDRYGFSAETFPVATDISERTLSLPLSPKVTEEDQEDVARALGEALV